MKKIILASHGDLAKGMMSTIKMLSGIDENIYSFSFHEGQNVLTIQDDVRKIINESDESDEFIIITDIPGGSVNTALMPLLEYKNVHLISGMNTLLVLTLVLDSDINASSILNCIEEGRNSMVYINENINTNNESGDFFD